MCIDMGGSNKQCFRYLYNIIIKIRNIKPIFAEKQYIDTVLFFFQSDIIIHTVRFLRRSYSIIYIVLHI